jgi:predicted naringenin-chalcone synthase
MSFIWSIDTALPPYKHSQADILSFMQAQYTPEETDLQRLKLMYQRSGIEYRYSVLPDFNNDDESKLLFKSNLQPDVNTRLACYQSNAASIAEQAVHNCLHDLPEDTSISLPFHVRVCRHRV